MNDIPADQLAPLDTPSKDGMAHEGTMWRVELAVDRRHYDCPAAPANAEIPAGLPSIVQCTVDGQYYWRCVACTGLWTADKHWAEPDYRIQPAGGAS